MLKSGQLTHDMADVVLCDMKDQEYRLGNDIQVARDEIQRYSKKLFEANDSCAALTSERSNILIKKNALFTALMLHESTRIASTSPPSPVNRDRVIPNTPLKEKRKFQDVTSTVRPDNHTSVKRRLVWEDNEDSEINNLLQTQPITQVRHTVTKEQTDVTIVLGVDEDPIVSQDDPSNTNEFVNKWIKPKNKSPISVHKQQNKEIMDYYANELRKKGITTIKIPTQEILSKFADKKNKESTK